MTFSTLRINLRLMRYIVLLLSLSVACTVHAQERCGTVQYEKSLIQLNPKKESIDQFEKWINKSISRRKANTQRTQRTQATITIPVVVHVIHKGEPIGVGTNLSGAQIMSQMKVLNDDFNRLNADRVNTPALFQPVAGSFDIEFVLAKQDPDQNVTSGIVRVRGSKTSWTSNDNFLLKSQSYWPADKYLNIWVTHLTDFLGYAQFPVSNLPGLEDSPNDNLTDGIVINYREFGSVDGGSFDLHPRYNKGRTLTHEMGHFFGLRHIWGDVSTCSSTDYVADTPVQDESTNNCPTHPRTSCSATKMFQNYLDYTDDACMNVFTQGQIARMNTVLQESPRRRELPTSIGSTLPTASLNDLGIASILSPANTACSGLVIPSIIVRNFGLNQITSAQIQLKRNNAIIETKNILLNLVVAGEVGEVEQQIDFLPIPLSPSTSNQFEFLITFTNSGVDGRTSNNSRTVTTITPAVASLPIVEKFNSFPSGWSVSNPDNLKTWQVISSVGPAIYLDFYSYTDTGLPDQLITPLINLGSASSATLLFDRAYAQKINESGSVETPGASLQVLASNACNFTNSAITLFSKSDEALATAFPTSCEFVPSKNEWVTEVVSLNQFVGQSMQLAFDASNVNGNNLYIRNVRVITESLTDLKLVRLESPSPVSCSSSSPLQFRVKNNGNVTINSFTTSLSINGGSPVNQTHSELNIESNGEQLIELSSAGLAEGVNAINISILNPNGVADQNDNSGSYQVIINNASEIIPLRERFETNSFEKWSIGMQGQQTPWARSTTNFSQSLFYNSFANTSIGDESWLVSPIFDFTNNSKASLFFDASYANRFDKCETLRLVGSTDCGLTFDDILFQKAGSELAVTNNQNLWTPTLESDWKKDIFVNLENYVGRQNVRFAFIAINGNGNNVYLDNIDFYEDDSSTQGPCNPANEPCEPAQNPYSIYGDTESLKITFNLEERQVAHVQVFNSIGQKIADQSFPETLNQTRSIELTEHAKGIYVIRLQIGNQLSARKIYIDN
jgi:hypothetical protein